MTSNSDTTTNEIAGEIGRLHDFFTAWYNGSIDEASYEVECGAHLSEHFLNVQPGGARLNREVFNAAIKGGYDVNPDFKIETRNAEIRATLEEGRRWLVTYEEYQKGARSSPELNARFSTLLIERRDDGSYLWHHLHETWLPEDYQTPEHYDF